MSDSFQERVQPWMMACFGAEIAGDREERNHRFFEEAGELVQSLGMTESEAHQLVAYTWGRTKGEPAQEVGGVMVTLAALCLANGLDMHAAAETELARIWTKVDQIRAKQAAKPKHSPLPQATTPKPLSEDVTPSLQNMQISEDVGRLVARVRTRANLCLSGTPVSYSRADAEIDLTLLDTLTSSKPSPSVEEVLVEGSSMQLDSGEWSAEVQSHGGYGQVAVFYGQTRQEAEGWRARFLAIPVEEVEGLREALRTIEQGATNAFEFFEARLAGRTRPTWYAVNVLQDHLEATRGTARAALLPEKDKADGEGEVSR
jgi:hypothetical protein